MPTLTEVSLSASALKFGRLPGRVPAGLRELGFYTAGPLPKAPSVMPVPAIDDWQMLGNDRYGDCGVAGLQHLFMADAANIDRTDVFPDESQAVSYYLEYTQGRDGGVVLSDYLAYVRQHEYYGHTVFAYAPVNIHDVPTLQFAIWAYDAAYCGVAVTKQMQEDFENGDPWTLESLEAPVLGGHCIPIVGYDSNYLTAITWGQPQQISYAAWHYMAEEAWAVITGEFGGSNGDGHGVNLAALQADLSRLAG